MLRGGYPGRKVERASPHRFATHPARRRSPGPRQRRSLAPIWHETTSLGGLIKSEGKEKTEHFRAWPLVSYRSENGGETDLGDWTSLFSYQAEANGSSFHVLSPLIFDYENDAGDCSWVTLFGLASYTESGTDSEFNLLYYLYRQKTVGTETRRDVFPFITWDSGEKRSGFSFFWRLFDYEREGDKTSGHVFFIPWGDSEG